MGQQRVVLELPELGDRVNQQARIVIQRIHVWRGRFVGEAVAGEVEQVDVEIGVELAGQRNEINARGGEAVHADQCRRTRCAAAAGEDGDIGVGVRGGRRLPVDFCSAASPFVEDAHQEPTGNTIREVPKCTSWVDGLSWLPVEVGSPVPRLRSKRGLLPPAISTRMRVPARNRCEIASSSRLTWSVASASLRYPSLTFR